MRPEPSFMSEARERRRMNGAGPDEAEEPPDNTGPCPDWSAEVARLARMAPIEADRVKGTAASRVGCVVSTLRDQVRRSRGEAAASVGDAAGRPLALDAYEPWHEPVDGAELLMELAQTFDRYLALPKHAE